MLSKVIQYVQDGWLSLIPDELKPYWVRRNELSVTDFTEVTSRKEDTSQDEQGGQAIRYQNLKEVIRPIASLGFGSNRIRT